jgi:DHA1 family inner membrane transport protein
LNIGVFNVGNALGAWAGGVVIDEGAPLNAVPLAGAGMALAALVLACLALGRDKPAGTKITCRSPRRPA